MTDIDVRINGAGTRFTTLSAVPYDEECITVPEGFTCDMASVPKLLWWWLPPLGRYAHAALLHDYLYSLHRLADLGERRSRVDLSFLRQMKRDGVGWRTRWVMYLAVRAFGRSAWNGQP